MNQYITINEVRELESQIHPKGKNRLRLWSIVDIMERFQVALFGIAVSRIMSVGLSIAAEEAQQGKFNRTNICQEFKSQVLDVFNEDVKIPSNLRWKMNRVDKRLHDTDCNNIEAMTLIRELYNDIIAEFTQYYFLMIPAERKPYYEQKVPLFGLEVDAAFPSATFDISAAGRCLALDEWTACVFHLMRVLEIGLRDLARWVGLPESSMEFENWKTIIDQIEKQIRNLEQAPKGQEKSEKLQFYSEAASNFRLFKDAWRNHVSHSRAHYDERDAVTVYNSVQAFMQSLAKHNITNQIADMS